MFGWLLNLIRRFFGGVEENAYPGSVGHFGQVSASSAPSHGVGSSVASTNDPALLPVDLEVGKDDDDSVPTRYSYALRDDFLSPAEASFFRVLLRAIPDDAIIFSKVRLADLIYPPKQESQYGAWQKINRKHVDFVLCATSTLRPRLVIELDDRSHRRANRIERDAFVDGIFAEVGLPILRVPARHSYATAQLAGIIGDALGAEEQQAAPPQTANARPGSGGVKPTCGRCGGEMRLRTATQGRHSGEQFWGCVNFPHCRFTSPFQSASPVAASKVSGC